MKFKNLLKKPTQQRMPLCKCYDRTVISTMSPRLASPTVHIFFCFWQWFTTTTHCVLSPFTITARMHNMTTWKMILFHLDRFFILFFMNPTEMTSPWVYCEFITNVIDAIHNMSVCFLRYDGNTFYFIIRSISSPFQNEDLITVPDSMYAIQS